MLYIGKYEECYELATKQILSAYDDSQYELDMVNEFLIVFLLGLSRYKEIIDMLKDIKVLDLTKLTCLLVALYESNKNDYNKFFEENINLESLVDDHKEYITRLNYYLRHRDKKLLLKMDGYNVMAAINILKKI